MRPVWITSTDKSRARVCLSEELDLPFLSFWFWAVSWWTNLAATCTHDADVPGKRDELQGFNTHPALYPNSSKVVYSWLKWPERTLCSPVRSWRLWCFTWPRTIGRTLSSRSSPSSSRTIPIWTSVFLSILWLTRLYWCRVTLVLWGVF